MRIFMDIYVFVVQMQWIAGVEVVLHLVTLTFDSSPIKGEGEYGWCCLAVCPTLWILP